MATHDLIKLFDGTKIRVVWDDKQEKYYFSVVDVVSVLTENGDYQLARNYWKVLKHRLIKEGAEPVTICNQLKLIASDGKRRETDVDEGWGQIVTPPYLSNDGRSSEIEFCGHAIYPV